MRRFSLEEKGYRIVDNQDLCCRTPTCLCGEPLTTHCYACGKECKTCKVRTDGELFNYGEIK